MKALLIILVLLILPGLGYLAFQYYNQYLKPPLSPLVNITPVTTEPVSLTLSLSSPDDNLLTFSPDLLIQGKTSKGASVILSSEVDDQILSTDTDSNFSLTLKLQKGINILTISAFDNQGNIKTENRTVFYATEKI